MNLIFIYGAPAVGKLTVAEELSRHIKYPVFHNHLTVDLAKTLFDNFNSDEFRKYREKLRYEFLEMAAKNDISIISTFVYAPIKYDNLYIKRVMKIIKKYNGKIFFVHLSADNGVLHKRVRNDSRKRFHKIKKVKKLKELMKKHNNFPKIPFVKSLEINNTNISASKTAKTIKEYYKL